jgi:hypothetical protein
LASPLIPSKGPKMPAWSASTTLTPKKRFIRLGVSPDHILHMPQGILRCIRWICLELCSAKLMDVLLAVERCRIAVQLSPPLQSWDPDHEQ